MTLQDAVITSANSEPQVPDLTGLITTEHKYPSAHGGFANVWLGIWVVENGVRRVAVKVLRSHNASHEQASILNKRLQKELHVWRRLDHDHVLPLFGTTSDFGPYISMVCPWQENGNLTQYLESCGPELSLSKRLRILVEVASGLAYLHDAGIVHGDLSGSNVLISKDEKAVLADFGLSRVTTELTSHLSSTSSCAAGAVRWAAPELLFVGKDGHIPSPTILSDVYSFASVMYQILTGRFPYDHLRTDVTVIIELNQGARPRRPLDGAITDAQWAFMERCWSEIDNCRPQASFALKTVEKFLKDAMVSTSDLTDGNSMTVMDAPCIQELDIDASTEGTRTPTARRESAPSGAKITRLWHPVYTVARRTSGKIANMMNLVGSHAFPQGNRRKTLIRRLRSRFLPVKGIMSQIGPTEHQGWMSKKGTSGMGWKYRYFVLRGTVLYCLENSSPKENALRGYVNVAGCIILPDNSEDGKYYGFRIMHRRARAHSFRSDRRHLIEGWLSALAQAVQKESTDSDVSITTLGSSISIPSITSSQ